MPRPHHRRYSRLLQDRSGKNRPGSNRVRSQSSCQGNGKCHYRNSPAEKSARVRQLRIGLAHRTSRATPCGCGRFFQSSFKRSEVYPGRRYFRPCLPTEFPAPGIARCCTSASATQASAFLSIPSTGSFKASLKRTAPLPGNLAALASASPFPNGWPNLWVEASVSRVNRARGSTFSFTVDFEVSHTTALFNNSPEQGSGTRPESRKPKDEFSSSKTTPSTSGSPPFL